MQYFPIFYDHYKMCYSQMNMFNLNMDNQNFN